MQYTDLLRTWLIFTRVTNYHFSADNALRKGGVPLRHFCNFEHGGSKRFPYNKFAENERSQF